MANDGGLEGCQVGPRLPLAHLENRQEILALRPSLPRLPLCDTPRALNWTKLHISAAGCAHFSAAPTTEKLCRPRRASPALQSRCVGGCRRLRSLKLHCDLVFGLKGRASSAQPIGLGKVCPPPRPLAGAEEARPFRPKHSAASKLKLPARQNEPPPREFGLTSRTRRGSTARRVRGCRACHPPPPGAPRCCSSRWAP